MSWYTRKWFLAAFAAFWLLAGTAQGQIGSTFTYQGRVLDGSLPANGIYDFEFSLWTASAAGAQVGGTLSLNDQLLEDGLVTADLNFGASAFLGATRWLEIAVKADADAGFTTLSPRQPILPTPYAMASSVAANVGDGGLPGVYSGAVSFTNPGNTFTGNGSGLTKLNASNVTTGSLNAARLPTGGSWSLSSNLSVDVNTLVVDQANSRIGVGTSAPSERFHVANGDLRVDGNLEVFDAVGANQRIDVDHFPEGSFFAYKNVDTGLNGMAVGVAGFGGSGFVNLFNKNNLQNVFLAADADGADDGVEQGLIRVRSRGGSIGGEVAVLNDDGTETMTLLGGGPSGNGSIGLFNATTGSQTASLNGDVSGFGGEVFTFSEDGFIQSIVQPDFDGEGTFVSWRRTNLGTGLTFDGNFIGTGNPFMSISGAVSSTSINTSASGNGSVSMPTDAVSAFEILDEPGVANNHLGNVALTSTSGSIASRTITCPTDGFVLVLAQGDLAVNHVNGSGSLSIFGVNDAAGSLPVNQDVQSNLPSGASSGTWDQSASAHGLFEVSAGANTFHFNASYSGGGTATMFDIQLTCIFFPTAYGTTVSNFTGGGGESRLAAINDPLTTRPPLTREEIAAEQAEAETFHEQRMASEFELMRRQMAELQKRIEEMEREQGLDQRPAAPTPRRGPEPVDAAQGGAPR